jgi:hypothetical protein
MPNITKDGEGKTHYTTTPMDNLMLKAATATDDLSLKSYSDRLLSVSPIATNL